MQRFNLWLAEHLAGAMSSMGCFYCVLAIVLIPLVWQRPSDLILWTIFLSSTVFQAIALPVLAIVNNQSESRLLALVEATHEATINELQVLREEMLILHEIRQCMTGTAIQS